MKKRNLFFTTLLAFGSLHGCKEKEQKTSNDIENLEGISDSKEKSLKNAKEMANPTKKPIDSIEKERDSILEIKKDSVQ